MAEYIEREALRDRMENVDWFHVNDSGVLVHGATSEMESYLPTKEVYRVIDEAPAADVAPVVHGRWFDTGVENETGSIYFCSACNKYNNPNKKDVKMRRAKEKPDYCPNCGAKMDLEKDNT